MHFEVLAAARVVQVAACVRQVALCPDTVEDAATLTRSILTNVMLNGQLERPRFDAAEAAAWGGRRCKAGAFLQNALIKLNPDALRALRPELSGKLSQAGLASDAAPPPGDLAAWADFLRRCSASLGRAALVAPRAWRDLLGPGAAGGGRRGAAAGCVRRQYARAATRSMDQACTPGALAGKLLRLQALRAAAAATCSAAPPPGTSPAAAAASAAGMRADCLAELAFDPKRPGPPRHLRDGEAAWHAAQQLGLEGAWTAEEGAVAAQLLDAFEGEREAALAGAPPSDPLRAAVKRAAPPPPAWLARTGRPGLGQLMRLAAAMGVSGDELHDVLGARGEEAAHAARARLGPRRVAELRVLVGSLAGARPAPAAAAAAAARRGALLLLQAGVVADAAAAGPWCGLAAEYHQRLAGLAEAAGDEAQGGGDDEGSANQGRTAPPRPEAFLEAMDRAAEAVGPGALLAAAPWFHADHLLGGGGATGAAAAGAERPADKECDWCGEEALTGGQSGGGLECASCGCARYCSQACAARESPLHARNCWRLRLLSAKGAVLRARFDPERPAFDYGDDPAQPAGNGHS